MKEKNNFFMTHRPLADMHGDGVYFSETLLAIKKVHDKEMSKIVQQSKYTKS